jgi:hypothetical protein
MFQRRCAIAAQAHRSFRLGREGGEAWRCLFGSLPPIHCIKVAVV